MGNDRTTVLYETSTNSYNSGDDPHIVDLLLGDEANVYIVIEADGRSSMEEQANFYVASISVQDEPNL